MKFFLITDSQDACTGLRLAGICSALVQNEEQLKKALDSAVVDPENGLILVTQGLYEKYPSLIDDKKRKFTEPLITEIPDSTGEFRSDAIIRYVTEAVGIA